MKTRKIKVVSTSPHCHACFRATYPIFLCPFCNFFLFKEILSLRGIFVSSENFSLRFMSGYNIIFPLQNSMHYNPFWQRNCHQGNTSTWVDRNLLNDNLMNRVAIFIKNTSTFVLLYDLTTLTLRIWHINWHVAAKLCQRVRDTIWWRRK